jgi:hypothetical protein
MRRSKEVSGLFVTFAHLCELFMLGITVSAPAGADVFAVFMPANTYEYK